MTNGDELRNHGKLRSDSGLAPQNRLKTAHNPLKSSIYPTERGTITVVEEKNGDVRGLEPTGSPENSLINDNILGKLRNFDGSELFGLDLPRENKGYSKVPYLD